jgi:hypothetical protein
MLGRRFANARPYEAPNHRGVVGLRLQGFEEGDPEEPVDRADAVPAGRWGGAGLDAVRKGLCHSQGEMTVIANGVETVHGKYDSCTIAPNEVREIVNRGNHVWAMLVLIPYPGAEP